MAYKDEYQTAHPFPIEAFNTQEFEKLYTYAGKDLGACYELKHTCFRVWAPSAEAMHVLLYKKDEGGRPYEERIMKRDLKGTFFTEVKGDLNGVYYNFKCLRRGKWIEVVDPYAKAVGINGQRGMVIDLATTNPEGWEEQLRPRVQQFTDAIIYELHIRDLSMHEHSGMYHKGKFLALTEKGTQSPTGEQTGVDHIQSLGITHIQLLPCFDYLSVDEHRNDEFNWGYDPLNYNVPEGSYATDAHKGAIRIFEFKTAIQSLHERGLQVVMDVVYNHTGLSQNSNFNLLEPNYYYRIKPDGSFSNASACGNEIASERSMVRKFIIDSVVYWAKEYKIDGFRFDLMGVLDIETMLAVRSALNEIDPKIMLYGEGWTGGPAALPEHKLCLKKNGKKLGNIGFFNDDIRDGIKGHVFNAKETGFVNGGAGHEERVKFGLVGGIHHPQIHYEALGKGAFANNPDQSINYVSAHDNLTLWDKLSVTCPHESIEERLKMQALSNAIVLLAQGVPFLHAGVEMVRSKGGDENSYKSPDAVNELDWDKKAIYKNIYEYYSGLIKLRKAHPAFRMEKAEEVRKHLRFLENLPAQVVAFRLMNHAGGDEWEEIVVIFNASPTSQMIKVGKRQWQIVVRDEVAGVETLDHWREENLMINPRSTLVLHC